MTKPDSREPKEFWIENYISSHKIRPQPEVMHRYDHVIEYSAYSELVALAKDLAGALENYEDINNEGGPNTAMQALERHRDLLARLK